MERNHGFKELLFLLYIVLAIYLVSHICINLTHSKQHILITKILIIKDYAFHYNIVSIGN